MYRKMMLAALALIALGATACSSYSAAVPSVQGKAYVVGSHFFSQSMYQCDATSGKPVCTEQKEQDLE
jgi:uncharacterized membrane protein YgdD (TMEM256/DUF423 family)